MALSTTPRWSWPGGKVAAQGLLTGVYLLLVWLPLAPLGLALFQAEGPEVYWLALPWGRRFWLLLQSLVLSGAVALGSMGLAFLAATWLWRWQEGLPSRLRWLGLALVLLPPYLTALAWLSLGASLAGWFPAPTRGLVIPGALASWWVQVLAYFPLALGFSLLGLETVEADLVEAGRLQQGDVRTLVRIVLPLASPYLLSGGALIVLLSLLDYSVWSLFGVSVYSLEIFAQYAASHSAGQAVYLALPLMLLTSLVVVAGQGLLRQMFQSRRDQIRRRHWVFPSWPGWFRMLQAVALGVLALHLLVPVVTLGAWVASPANLWRTWSTSTGQIGFTLGLALASALICLPVALGISGKLVRSSSAWPGWWFLVLLPLAVPPPLVGVGLIGLSGLPPWSWAYGTFAMPVLATVARFLPLAVLVLLAGWRQFDPLWLEAAALLESRPGQTLKQIVLPLLAPGCLAGAAVVGALSAGELGAVLLVLPAGLSTLSITLYNYLHYGAVAAVGGLGLFLGCLALLAGLLAVAGFQGWRLKPWLASHFSKVCGDPGNTGR